MHPRYNILEQLKAFLRPNHERSAENIKKRRAAKQLKRTAVKQLSDIFLMLAGVLSAGFGLKGFLIQNGFIDGGVTGTG